MELCKRQEYLEENLRTSTPLHLLSGSRSPYAYAMLQTLLRWGLNPNAKNCEGITPLHIASSWGHYEILKLLLLNGGDPEIGDNDGKTALDHATEADQKECRALLQWWCDSLKNIESPIAATPPRKVSRDVQQRLYSPRFFASPLKDVQNIQRMTPTSTHSNSTYSPRFFTSPIARGRISIEGKTGGGSARNSPVVNSAPAPKSSWQIDSGTKSTTYFIESCSSSPEKISPKRMLNFDQCSISSSSKIQQDENERPIAEVERPSSNQKVETNNQDLCEAQISEDESTTSGNVPHEDRYIEFMVSKVPSLRESPRKLSIIKEIPSSATSSGSKRNCSQLSCLTAKTESTQNVTEIADETVKPLNDLNATNEFKFAADSAKKAQVDEISRLLNETFLSLDSTQTESLKSSLQASILSLIEEERKSIPEEILSECQTMPDRDLRTKLILYGIDVGPINDLTRALYVNKLAHLIHEAPVPVPGRKVYSKELEEALKGNFDLESLQEDEKAMHEFYEKENRTWREGNLKASFCYLLLDSRKIPENFDSLDGLDRFRAFIDAIFYIGKGKNSRPHQHLYDALELFDALEEPEQAPGEKLQTILSIWKMGLGVVSLHFFHNLLPVEAYTREAAMIDAIGIANLANIKRGDYYGLPSTWTSAKRKKFGAFLLNSACSIMKHDGVRQIRPKDITRA